METNLKKCQAARIVFGNRDEQKAFAKSSFLHKYTKHVNPGLKRFAMVTECFVELERT